MTQIDRDKIIFGIVQHEDNHTELIVSDATEHKNADTIFQGILTMLCVRDSNFHEALRHIVKYVDENRAKLTIQLAKDVASGRMVEIRDGSKIHN